MKTKRYIFSFFLVALLLLLVACDATPPPDSLPSEEGKENIAPSADTLCPHDFGAWETVRPATCLSAGKRTRVCTLCGVRMNEAVTEEDAHTERVTAALAPTCQSAGHTQAVTCTVCGEVLVRGETLERLPHTFDGGKCTACGAKKPSEGLLFARNATGYTVTGMGSCSDDCVVIPDSYLGLPVTEIGREAFAFLSHYPSEIFIPDSVRTVRAYAIDSMRFLTVYTGKNAVLEAHALGFHGSGEVVNQTGAELPSDAVLGQMENVLVHMLGVSQRSVTPEGFVFLKVGERALLCDYIGDAENITLPAYFQGGKYYVAPLALYGLDGVDTLTVGEGVLGIGEFAFAAGSWRTLNLFGSYDTLPTGVFMDCHGLTDVVIPSNVRVIEAQCFYNVRLGSVTLGASVEKIGHSFALSVAVVAYRSPKTPKISLQ